MKAWNLCISVAEVASEAALVKVKGRKEGKKERRQGSEGRRPS